MASSNADRAKRLRERRKSNGLEELRDVHIPKAHNDYLKQHGLKPKVVELIAGIVNGKEFTRPEANIYIMAARYARTRQTGAALQVVNEIIRNWSLFTKEQQQQLQREAQEAVYNLEDWARIAELVEGDKDGKA